MLPVQHNEQLDLAEQKIGNIIYTLNLVRTMVLPDNSQHNISICQKVIKQSDLLPLPCKFMFVGRVSAKILIETINTVAEVIHGFLMSQVHFNLVSAPSHPQSTSESAHCPHVHDELDTASSTLPGYPLLFSQLLVQEQRQTRQGY